MVLITCVCRVTRCGRCVGLYHTWTVFIVYHTIPACREHSGLLALLVCGSIGQFVSSNSYRFIDMTESLLSSRLSLVPRLKLTWTS